MARSALTIDDLIDVASILCTAGTFTKLGEYQVKAGEWVALGYGPQSGQDNAQGRFYADIKDNSASPGANIEGIVRISVLGPQNTYIEEVGQWRTEALRASNDRTKQVPLPFTEPYVSEDKKIILEFDPDNTATIGKANSALVIDSTRQLLK